MDKRVLIEPLAASQPSGPPFPCDDLYQTDWAYQALQEEIAENRRLDEAAEIPPASQTTTGVAG
jgi:hypothetical protein